MSRYDAVAEWYDETFGPYAAGPDSSASWITRLLGPGTGPCLYLACGSGRHAAAITATGRTVMGLDVSAGQLGIARRRLELLAQADVTTLPIRDASVDTVVIAYLHTDTDDMAPVFAEVTRVLQPGGRLVFLGVHPCFVGHFAEYRDGDARIVMHPGYREAGWRSSSPHTLAELVNALLAAGLRLERMEEFGGRWSLPRDLAMVAGRAPD